jgi:hypothetical protein
MRIEPADAAAAAAAAVSPGSAPAADVRALIAEFIDERSFAEGRVRALRGERVLRVDSVHALLEGGFGQRGRLGERVRFFLTRPLFVNDARLLAEDVTNAIRASNAPDLPSYKAADPDVLNDARIRPPWHPIAALLGPQNQRYAKNHYESLACGRAAATALAIRLYATDHGGQLPQKLDDLVPEYLASVPSDPLAGGGKPLGYARDPERPRLYHVGENGVDDGGREPSPTASRKENLRTSDVVFHLKRHPRPAAGESGQD